MGNLCSTFTSDSQKSRLASRSNTQNSKFLQLNHFNYISTLGEGAFAKVVLARRKTTQQLFAIKLIKLERLQDRSKREFVKFERQVLVELENPFIIKLHHIIESFGKLCFVLEFMQGGSLGFHLKKNSKFSLAETVFFAAEVLVGLEMLHKRSFIYRDLKPENILLDIDGHIKLADFNLSTTTEELSDRICGTPEYAPPEVIRGEIQGIEVDFWGFGVLLFHMIQGVTPFESKSRFETCEKILSRNFSFPAGFDKRAVDLISKLLIVNPRQRLSSHRLIKEHIFFNGVDWTLIEKKAVKSPLNLSVKDNSDLKYFPRTKHEPGCIEFDFSQDINASFASHSDYFYDLTYNSEIS